MPAPPQEGSSSPDTSRPDNPPGASILSGLRVIDCGTYIAGPAAATILSDFGAEVIKIERPPYGDPYRYLPQVAGMPLSDQNYTWILDARNKKSVALDLCDAQARAALTKLIASADIFITNYQPQLQRKFGLEYKDLAPLNPRLIYASVTGYGEAGDDAEKPGYDATAYWARSGLMHSMHNGDAEPVQSPAGFGDHPTSVTLFASIMLALYQRQITGRGAKVRTSLMANGVWSHSCAIQAALCGAQFLPKWTRKEAINPFVNHYLALDGRRLFFCLLEPVRDWPNLCAALDWPHILHDTRFNSADCPASEQRGADRAAGRSHRETRSVLLDPSAEGARSGVGSGAIAGGGGGRSAVGGQRRVGGDRTWFEQGAEDGPEPDQCRRRRKVRTANGAGSWARHARSAA